MEFAESAILLLSITVLTANATLDISGIEIVVTNVMLAVANVMGLKQTSA